MDSSRRKDLRECFGCCLVPTERFRMDMKKRISLELRNRSSAEVSRFPLGITGTVVRISLGAQHTESGVAFGPL